MKLGSLGSYPGFSTSWLCDLWPALHLSEPTVVLRRGLTQHLATVWPVPDRE